MTFRALLPLLIGLCLLCVVPGQVSAHETDLKHHSARYIDRYLMDLDAHADSKHELSNPQLEIALADQEFGPSVSRAALSGNDYMADTWCGASSAVNDTVNALNNSDPVFKIFYAYPSDQVNRFDTYKDLIQSRAKISSQIVTQASNNTQSLRFDMGTSCGPQYLDVQVVQLPNTLAYYKAQSDRFGAVTSAVAAVAGASPQKRNYVVWADYVGEGYGASGEGQMYNGTWKRGDGSFGRTDTKGSGNIHNNGELWSVLWGRGGTNFYGGTALWFSTEVLLHEMTHNLGGVQFSSPNNSGAVTYADGSQGGYGHCFDEYDLECYNDGGPAWRSTVPCPDSNGNASLIWDCGQNDYYNPNPASGSYLDSYWNIKDSVFLCALASCSTAVTNQPPVAKLSASPAVATVGASVSFSAAASSDDQSISSFQWDFNGDGVYDQSTSQGSASHVYAEANSYTVTLRVVDSGGLSAQASTVVQVQAANGAPSAVLDMPLSASAGKPVSLSALRSSDDKGISRYEWDINADGSVDASGAQVSWAFATPGRYPVALKVVDAEGANSRLTREIVISSDEDGDSELGVSLNAASPQPLTQALSRGVSVRVKASRATRLKLVLSLSPASARKLKWKKRSTALASRSVSLRSQQDRLLRVKPSKPLARALRRSRKLSVSLSVREEGSSQQQTVPITLRGAR